MKYLLIFIALFFVGCATKLLPQAESVALLYEKPQNCKLLGREMGQEVDSWGVMSLLSLRQSATNDLKNKAVSLGGDTIFVLNVEKGSNSIFGAPEYLIEGDIYECNNSDL